MTEKLADSWTDLDSFFFPYIKEVIDASRLGETKAHVQHGSTSVFLHNIAVAYRSCCIAKARGRKCDLQKLVRGALLHDYFLYDWHEKTASRLHGFTHPGLSLKNAMGDFELCNLEQDIIKRHMFPLTIVPPRHRESFIVCLADKLCSTYEVFSKRPYPILKQKLEFTGFQI